MDSIIFDVDGTLWDSTEIVARSWNQYLEKTCGQNPGFTGKRLKSLFGLTLPVIAARLFPDCSAEEQMRLIEGCCQAEHDALLKTPAPLYEDLAETLTALSRRFRLFIVSNSQAGYIEVFLRSTGLSHLFEGHLCAGDTGREKGENIAQVCREYRLEDPVYVGDTLGDYEASKKAGIPFVLAGYGFGEVPSPDYRIEKPSDLRKLFL